MLGTSRTAQPIAVFDISSSSVGGAHVLLEKTPKTPTVLAQFRIDAPLQEDMDMARFVNETVQNLELVVEEVRKADVHHPTYVQLVLASPWYLSQTRTIVYKKTAPFTCTEKLIDSLIQKEVDYILTNDMQRFGAFGKEGVVVEKQLSLIKLNGYTTSNPYGKRAETMELFLTVTVAPKIIIDTFETVLRRTYGVRKIGITTSPYATFVVARDYFGAEHECVIIDVGEEITDVAFVKNNLFLYQHSFPVGTYELYRTLAMVGNHTPAEARTIIEAYRLGKLSDVAKGGVDTALVAFKKKWQQGLIEILDGGHYGFCLPEQCYITADPRFELIFTDIITTDPFIQHTCSRGIVRPLFINDEKVKDLIKTIDMIALDIPIGTASLFAERLMYYNKSS
jgi:hypothetical protein